MENKEVQGLFKEFKRQKWYWWEYPEIWWHRYFWNWVTDLKWKIPNWWQRGWRGWGFADTWNLSGYLATVIYESLVYLKTHVHGYLVWDKNSTEEEMERKSNEICDKMIYAFKLAKDIEEGTREFYLPDLSESLKKKCDCLTKEEDDAMKEGMKLFVELFFSLWD